MQAFGLAFFLPSGNSIAFTSLRGAERRGNQRPQREQRPLEDFAEQEGGQTSVAKFNLIPQLPTGSFPPFRAPAAPRHCEASSEAVAISVEHKNRNGQTEINPQLPTDSFPPFRDPATMRHAERSRRRSVSISSGVQRDPHVAALPMLPPCVVSAPALQADSGLRSVRLVMPAAFLGSG